MSPVPQDAQIEFWMTVGLILGIIVIFFLFFYGWPQGGDPSKGSGHGPTDGPGV